MSNETLLVPVCVHCGTSAPAFFILCAFEGQWSTLTLCMYAHVSSYLLLIELNWDQKQKLKAENERSTQVAISIIKEQKWRRGAREEGWKEMICSVNPNWITLITSPFLALFHIFFSISFQTSTFLFWFLGRLQDDMRHSLSLVAAGWSLSTIFL